MEDSWKTGFVHSGAVLLEYKMQARTGKPWLLFFHGYGQDFRAFQPVYEALAGDFSFLALHLPRHGESRLETDKVLSKEEWAVCLEKMLNRLETGPVKAIAFSMGAKFLLAAAEEKPELFKELILLAPDGLVMNPWYRLATMSVAGRVCLKSSLGLFPVFRRIIALLSAVGLVRPALLRFALSELGTTEGRKRVLNVWLQFRKLWPDQEKLKLKCLENNILIFVYLGRFDGILSVSRYIGFRKKNAWMNWEIMNTGHTGLIEEFARHGL
jgi:pimeloyl-ACP methyl ester carboxylesterase